MPGPVHLCSLSASTQPVPLGVTVAGSWAGAGCAVQEADPAVWAINSAAAAGRKLCLMVPGLRPLPPCRSVSWHCPSPGRSAKAEACVHPGHCAAGLLCDLWALLALSVPPRPSLCVRDASVLPVLGRVPRGCLDGGRGDVEDRSVVCLCSLEVREVSGRGLSGEGTWDLARWLWGNAMRWSCLEGPGLGDGSWGGHWALETHLDCGVPV